MARPQRQLDVTKPLHAFADELRKLRASAGDPKYLVMARRVGDVSRTALSEAAGGDHLPTWHTLAKFVTACGGDPNDWRQRWEELRDTGQGGHRMPVVPVRDVSVATPVSVAAPGSGEALDSSRRRVGSRWVLPVAAVGTAVLLALAGHALTNGEDADARTDPPAAVPTGPVVIVQNAIAVGADGLIEDPTPAYLSTRPIPRCRTQGCMIRNSQLTTGTTVVATCHVTGVLVVNYNRDSTEVQRNPHRAASPLWYRLVLADGRAGYLAEIYLTPASRGGLGLPPCAPNVPISPT